MPKDKGQILYCSHFSQHSLVSSDWDVASMEIFQQFLKGGISDGEAVDTAGWIWSGVDSSLVNCVYVSVLGWRGGNMRERGRDAALQLCWIDSHYLQNRAHALNNTTHNDIPHFMSSWNTAYENQWEKSRYASPTLSIECRDTVPSTAETAGELTSSCLSLSVLFLLVRVSIGKWVEVVGGAEIELSHAISRPLSKDVVLFSCCFFSSSCNFSSFFLIRCLALLEGLCFLAVATSCVFVIDGVWLFNASLFDGTLGFASRSNEWSLDLGVNFVLCGNGKNLLYPYNKYNIRINTEF